MKNLLFALLLSIAYLLPAQVIHHENVPMRDGVSLATDIYLPFPGTSAYPVILMRTPYDKDTLATYVIYLTMEGYAAVVQDTRGHGASGGDPSAFMTDGTDGYDTVEWVASQSWSNGKIGALGASALGIANYFMAGEAPPHLTCMISMVATPDLYSYAIYPGGCFREYDITGWMEDTGEDANLPLVMDHPMHDSLWDVVDLDGKYGDVTVPTLHVGGWYDLFADGTLQAYRAFHRFSQARADQMLIMGPWTHGGMATSSEGELTYPANSILSDADQRMLAWFDYYLKGSGSNPAAEGSVALYLMGDVTTADSRWNTWISGDEIPEIASTKSLYLNADGSLGETAGSGSKTFTSDPDNPVPTIGGANLLLPAGPYDQAQLLDRADVVAFSTAPLNEPIETIGKVKGELFISADVPDLDIACRLVDIYPDGRWILVTDGIMKARYRNGFDRETFLSPNEVIRLTVAIGSTAYLFAPGHRVGLIVSGSNYPRFAVNPQSGEAVNEETTSAVAHVTVHTSPRYPSRLLLPSIDTSGHSRPFTKCPPGAANDGSRVKREQSHFLSLTQKMQ